MKRFKLYALPLLLLGPAAVEASEPQVQQPASSATEVALSAADIAKQQKSDERAQAKVLKDLKKKYGEGPYPGELVGFVESKPEVLRPLFKTLYLGGERNAVLNYSRLGLAAIEVGEWSVAERAFDGALTRIESVYSKNKAAEQAKSVWKKEARKEFKGEPYERAMAYYYRGLLYLRSEDYDNARASFKSALFQDSINLDGDRGQDFVSMNYLAGWASHCAGDNSDAQEQFGYAVKGKAALTAPVAGSNTLYVAEIGKGPEKVKAGANMELLEFKSRADWPETRAVYSWENASVSPIEAASLTYQAAERDGRKMDGVLKGKAETKQMTSAMGDAMMNNALSNPYASSGSMLGGLFGGLMMKALSSTMRADADIRMWDSLPDRIMISADKPAQSSRPLAVAYFNGDVPVELTPAAMHFSAGKKCSLAWSRSRSALSFDPATPGDDAGVAKASSSRKDVQLKDKAFRDNLAIF